MQSTPATEMEMIDQLAARLLALEAQAVAFQDDGAEALRRLSPELVSNIFLGVQQAAVDCRALVRQLDEARFIRATGASSAGVASAPA